MKSRGLKFLFFLCDRGVVCVVDTPPRFENLGLAWKLDRKATTAGSHPYIPA